MTSNAPSPLRRPSSETGILASSAGPIAPSTLASMAMRLSTGGVPPFLGQSRALGQRDRHGDRERALGQLAQVERLLELLALDGRDLLGVDLHRDRLDRVALRRLLELDGELAGADAPAGRGER